MTEFPEKPVLPFRERTTSAALGWINLIFFFILFYFILGQDLKEILVLLGVLLCHELGHLIVMQRLGYKDLQLFMLPMLASQIEGEKKEIAQSQRSWLVLAGSLPGILLGGGLFLAAKLAHIEALERPAFIFLLLNAFFLLPLNHLDGGYLLDTLFVKAGQVVQVWVLRLVAIGLSVLILVQPQKEYFMLVLPLILFMRSFIDERIERVRRKLRKQEVNYQQFFKDLSNEEYWRIRAEVIRSSKQLQDVSPEEYKVVKAEPAILSQMWLVVRDPLQLDLGGLAKLGIVLLWIAALVGAVLLLGWGWQ